MLEGAMERVRIVEMHYPLPDRSLWARPAVDAGGVIPTHGALFPLNRGGRLRRNVVHRPVDTGHLIDDPVGDVPEEIMW